VDAAAAGSHDRILPAPLCREPFRANYRWPVPSRTFLAPPVLLLIGIGLALTVWSVTSVISEGGGVGIISGGVILLTLSFYAFAIPTVIYLSRRRRVLVPLEESGGVLDVEGTQPPGRVTRIGWIALALGIAGPALFFLMGWGFSLALEYASQPDSPLIAELWGYLFLVWVSDVLAAVVVCTVAGTRGRGNRMAGVAGGLVLASPIALLFWVF